MPCCIQACIYPTSKNGSQGRTSAFPFSATRNACSSEKKVLQARGGQQPEEFMPFLARSLPAASCSCSSAADPGTLLSHNQSTWGQREHPWPGTACTSHPMNGQRPVFLLWDSCVSRGEDDGRGGLCMSWECLCQEPCVDFLAGKARKRVFSGLLKNRGWEMHLKIIVFFFYVYFMVLDENETWNNVCFHREHKFEGKKPICSHFYRAFQMNTSVRFVFSVITNKI